MSLNVSTRELKSEEIETALQLVWSVFLEYEAPDYTAEGVEEFKKSIHDKDYIAGLRLYGAFLANEMIGVIAARSGGTHIALFFVRGKYHRQGVGKRLFRVAHSDCPSDIMTVNSSPYAVPIYRRLGFRETAQEQTANGLRFTPMEMQTKGAEKY